MDKRGVLECGTNLVVGNGYSGLADVWGHNMGGTTGTVIKAYILAA